MKKVHKRKHDRLLSGWHDAETVAADAALAPVDRLMFEMERKWGQHRLMGLVDPETASKFGKAWARMEDAITQQNVNEIIKRAAIVLRGVQAMDAEAEKAGAEPASGEVLVHCTPNGQEFGILLNAAEWRCAREQYPDLTMVTLDEVGFAIQNMLSSPIGDVKKAFPDAKIKEVRPRGKTLDDEIPF